ncbi:hypothetical protein ACQPW1_29855 [Nocardia sp. CA-128927]|uniref:hypothetical protein n=1 Tax=Nocardia sp. CA-128927 TaxID=3239975 RepID=UPI003D96338A
MTTMVTQWAKLATMVDEQPVLGWVIGREPEEDAPDDVNRAEHVLRVVLIVTPAEQGIAQAAGLDHASRTEDPPTTEEYDEMTAITRITVGNTRCAKSELIFADEPAAIVLSLGP